MEIWISRSACRKHFLDVAAAVRGEQYATENRRTQPECTNAGEDDPIQALF